MRVLRELIASIKSSRDIDLDQSARSATGQEFLCCDSFRSAIVRCDFVSDLSGSSSPLLGAQHCRMRVEE
jgi:hypothetical protein